MNQTANPADSVVHVLLVDDNEAFAGIVRRFLRRAESLSFELDWADSFDKGLAALESKRYDICLLDYQLGARTGLELVDRLSDLGTRFPVILLTGMGNLDLALEALRHGVMDYLDKEELSAALLERSLRYALENFRAREALRRANDELEERVRRRTADLERSNAELERFAYIVCHELQMPLQTITRHIERIRDQYESQTESRDDFSEYFVERALDGANRMQRLIRSVLDYARVGRQAPPGDPIELREVIDEVLANLDTAIAETGAQIEVAEAPPVRGDRVLLGQLFENLIKNALKFRGETPPRVELSFEQRNGEWLCRVRDNGSGIRPEDRDDIFLIFHRGRAGRETAGDGIGLALCKRIVEHHEGEIWVESVPHGGTTFCFTVPALDARKEKACGSHNAG